jgi:hypothetical protein
MGLATSRFITPKKGMHILFLNLGSISTGEMKIVVGDSRSLSPKNATIPADYCLPWQSFNPSSLVEWALIYDDQQDIRIWKAP